MPSCTQGVLGIDVSVWVYPVRVRHSVKLNGPPPERAWSTDHVRVSVTVWWRTKIYRFYKREVTSL